MGSYPATAKLGCVVMGGFVSLWISECPRLFNCSFLLYGASHFRLHTGHLHLRTRPVMLLPTTAPVSPPDGTQRRWRINAATDLPRSSSARPTRCRGL